MLRQLWRLLFGGHDHHWEIVKQTDFALSRVNYNGLVSVTEHQGTVTKIISRCKICGELRSEEF